MSDATRGFFAVEPIAVADGDTAPSVGIQLRRAREQRKLTLTQVSRDLRLKEEILRAIESGQHSSLPSVSFATGYVRAYAGYLGIDPRGASIKFKDEVGAPAIVVSTLNVPKPMRESRFPGRFMVSASLVLGALVYGGWYLHVTESGEPTVASAPIKAPAVRKDDNKAIVTAGAPNKNNAPAKDESDKSAADAANGGAANGERAGNETPRAATPDMGATTSKNPGAEVPADLVVLKAKAMVWLDIREPSGAIVLQKALKAGEEFRVPQGKKLIANIGNPPGLEISVGGRTLKPFGASGRPMTNVSLDPARLAKLP